MTVVIKVITEGPAGKQGPPGTSASQTLAQVLANGHDANAIEITNGHDPTADSSLDTLGARNAAIAALATVYQPLDSDLTAIAALATTSFGRGLLALADAAALRTAAGLGTAATHASTDFDAAGAAAAAQAASQPLDSDLTAIAALTTTPYGRGLLTLASAAAADFLVKASNLSDVANAATARANLGLAIGTNVQAWDADLDAIAALNSSTAGAIASDGAGWIQKTYAQFKSALALVASDVGLGNVTNDAQLKASQLDTDGTLAANSDSRVPSQKAVKTYADQLLSAAHALEFKGVTDCSGNPNYPAAAVGDVYIVSVAGKIGGASGTAVDIGDMIVCITANAGGTQAAVGTDFSIVQANLIGAVTGPASVTSGDITTFNGTSGKIVQDSGVAISTDGTLAANSDSKIPTEKAIKTYTVAQARQIIAGTGLTGGGDLSADRTLALATAGPGATGPIGDGTHVPVVTIDAYGRVTALTSSAITVSGADKLGLTPTAVKTSAYTAAAGDLVPVDTSSGAVTITLPTAPADGTVVAIKLVKQTGTNAVTINCGGTDVFNVASGATSGTLALLNQATVLQYKSSTGIWYSVATDLALSQLDLRYVPESVVTAKGDILAATASGAVARVAVGANGQVPRADSNLTPGIGWKAEQVPFANWLPSSGKIETMPRFTVGGGAITLTSGTLWLLALPTPLLAGVTYTSITFFANATPSSPTHQWFTLVNKADLKTLRSTSDDTTTAWSTTAKTLNLTSTYTPTADIDAYVGIMVAATGAMTVRANPTQTALTNLTPLLHATANTGMTTPLADGTAVATLTNSGQSFYAVVS